eukprot:TRINITY_DN683_c3_g2_i1.p1 TRINITY_DN683_c3_g2~~TRINITY_DN683_c3_g2_i1.p1  ORF type:complete len:837 (+),score=189.12 TRINITY_DN683_c3_g2_i1:251-2761(+)
MEGLREVRHLGRGAFGEVVLAQRISDGTLCAVKHIKRQEMAENEVLAHRAEVRALQALQHPCILKYFASEEDKHALRIVTEYADAGDMQQLIKSQADSGKPFEVLVLLAMLAQLGTAIAHVHSKRVMHRDLKPANVFLTTAGLLKLGDFGVAKVMAGTTVMDQMTCVGSPTYMAPEIVGGEVYGPACDIWSLGVIIYELCCFKKPFEGRSLGELVMRISSGAFKKVTEQVEGAAAGVVAASVAPLLDLMLVVDAKRRAGIGEVLRHPILQMFVASMRSCRACLQVAFARARSSDAEATQELTAVPGFDCKDAEADLEAAGASALASAAAAPSSGGGRTRDRVPRAARPPTGGGSSNDGSDGGHPERRPRAKTDTATGSARYDGEGSFAESDTFALSRSADTFALSATSALGGSLGGGLGDTEISFAVTSDIEALAAQAGTIGPATIGIGATLPRNALETQNVATIEINPAKKPVKMMNSFDASYMREVLGGVLEEDAAGAGGTARPPAAGGAGRGRYDDDDSSDADDDRFGPQGTRAGVPSVSSRAANQLRYADSTLGATALAQDTLPSAGGATRPHVSSGARGQSHPGVVDPHWEVPLLQPSATPSGGGAAAARRLGGANGSSRSSTSRGSTPGSGGGARAGSGVPSAAQLARAAHAVVGGGGGSTASSPSGRRSPGEHYGQYSRVEDMEKSATWPVRDAHGLSGEQQRARHLAIAKANMRSTTPPAGRPTTPESTRRKKAEKEYLREAQRSGAMTIPFFDRKPGEPVPAPPERFRQAIEAHDVRQKRRALDRGETVGPRKLTPEKESSRGVSASASAPALRGGGGGGGSKVGRR